MSTDKDADLLTIAEAARRLKVSPLTIKRWIAQGRLPAYRVGPRHIRIKERDIEAIIRPAGPKPGKTTTETEPQDMWAGYDPEKVKAALRESAGALTGVDREALLQDLHEARQQESRGRPA